MSLTRFFANDPLFQQLSNVRRPWFFEDLQSVQTLPVTRSQVKETDQSLIYNIDVPGFDKNDLEVTVADDVVTIEGKKQQREESTSAEGDYFSFSSREVKEQFLLPEKEKHLDVEHIKVAYKNGVLSVVVPKAKPTVESGSKRKLAIT